MSRYRVIFKTTPSAGFDEFSADDDAAALAKVASMSKIYGPAVVLSDVSGYASRSVPLPAALAAESSRP